MRPDGRSERLIKCLWWGCFQRGDTVVFSKEDFRIVCGFRQFESKSIVWRTFLIAKSHQFSSSLRDEPRLSYSLPVASFGFVCRCERLTCGMFAVTLAVRSVLLSAAPVVLSGSRRPSPFSPWVAPPTATTFQWRRLVPAGSFPPAACLPPDRRPVGLYLGRTDAVLAGLGRLSLSLFIRPTDGAAVPAADTRPAAWTEAYTDVTLAHLLPLGFFVCHRAQKLMKTQKYLLQQQKQSFEQ